LVGVTYYRRSMAAALVLCISSLIIVVLADSRLGLLLCLLAFSIAVAPVSRQIQVLSLLPILAVTGLLAVQDLVQASSIDNSIAGRLYQSGRLLSAMNFGQWLGLVEFKRFTADSGYAYLIPRVGLVGVLTLWGMFLSAKDGARETAVIHAGLAYYVCTTLLISEAVFSIKTAALAWFILGASTRAVPDWRRPLLEDKKALADLT
jgi:putative polymerase